MKSLSEVISWLKEPNHISIILAEVKSVKVLGSSTTQYLSSKAYTSGPGDTIPNKFYEPCIIGGLSFTESLSLDASISIGYGDIEIANYNGERDTWLNYVWANREIDIYIGDPRWSRNDFYRIFTGIVSDISSRDASTLNLILLDKLEKLNKPITEEVLGGTGANKDNLKPIVFGEVFNMDPLYISDVPANLVYMVNNGATERIIEIRDNGVPLLGTSAPTLDLANGTFTLVRSPAGQITASVQGQKPSGTYTNNIANIIKHIVVNYGPTYSRLTTADIDEAQFTSFASTHTQPVGILCRYRENILDVCQQLASSVGASICFNNQGKLRIIQLTIPGTGTSYSVGPEDMELYSISISDKIPVISSVKLGYCRNWTVQSSGLAGSVPTIHGDYFSKEWLSTGVNDAVASAEYSLFDDAEQVDTLLLSSSTATPEANRRLNLWKTPRFMLSAVYYAHMLPVEIGDILVINHPRFGLTNKTTTVVDISRDWVSGRVTIGVVF